jgi:hypothetical protein
VLRHPRIGAIVSRLAMLSLTAVFKDIVPGWVTSRGVWMTSQLFSFWCTALDWEMLTVSSAKRNVQRSLSYELGFFSRQGWSKFIIVLSKWIFLETSVCFFCFLQLCRFTYLL